MTGKRSLRKTSSHISANYSGGHFSNNLVGRYFEAEESGGTVCLSIDLSSNLRVRNKEESCYYDACELVRDHARLESVQIFDEQVIEGLVRILRKRKGSQLKLELALGDKGTVKYSVVEIKKASVGIFLYVRSDA